MPPPSMSRRHRVLATLLLLLLLPVASLSSPSTHHLVRTIRRDQEPTVTTPEPEDEDLVSDAEWTAAATLPSIHNDSLPQPLLVHYTARTRVPSAEAAWLQASPCIDIRYYSDDDSRALVAQHRPDFLATYDTQLSAVERADYFRYLVLWVFGGLYVDSDIDFVRPVDQWLARFGWTDRPPSLSGGHRLATLDLVVGIEFPEPQAQYDATGWLPLQFTQFVFAGARHSDVLASILDHVERCVASVERHGDVERTLQRTGPAAFTRAILNEISTRGMVSESLAETHAQHQSDVRYPPALLPCDELERMGQLIPLKRAAVTPQSPDFVNRPFDLVLVLPYRAFAFHAAHAFATEAELTVHRFQNSWRSDV